MKFQLSYDRPAFAEYEASMRALERSFKRAGVPLTLEAGVLPEGGGKIIYVTKNGRVIGGVSVLIEGCSPARTVKDVAATVRI